SMDGTEASTTTSAIGIFDSDSNLDKILHVVLWHISPLIPVSSSYASLIFSASPPGPADYTVIVFSSVEVLFSAPEASSLLAPQAPNSNADVIIPAKAVNFNFFICYAYCFCNECIVFSSI